MPLHTLAIRQVPGSGEQASTGEESEKRKEIAEKRNKKPLMGIQRVSSWVYKKPMASSSVHQLISRPVILPFTRVDCKQMYIFHPLLAQLEHLLYSPFCGALKLKQVWSLPAF